MKAISLWQPWAALMAIGVKQIETRGWYTRHVGLLAICASKRIVDRVPLEIYPEIADALSREPMHYGKVVAVVTMTECRPTERIDTSSLSLIEEHAGNYDARRFAWITINPRYLLTPVPVIGRQGLFNLPPEVEAQVRAQL